MGLPIFDSDKNGRVSGYDVSIIGGGLGGLSLAIQLADAGYRVILFERKKYPFHRVCGEYISMESWDFLQRLGVPLHELRPPRITKLKVSSLKGIAVNHHMSPGGFGISRYTLDNELAIIARRKGVELVENVTVKGIDELDSRVIAGAFGKRSIMDKSLNRSGTLQADSPDRNWVGVKYHVRADVPEDEIQLHNFEGGYCGISKVDGDKYCLCYLTRAANLQRFQGDIESMEMNLLSANPFLKIIFSSRENFLFREPVTVSQISFQRKLPVENQVLMVGDSAGMIAPLCGNGMSMALHASLLCATAIQRFLESKISREEMERDYSVSWNRHFALRVKLGRMLQPILLRPGLSNILLSLLRRAPRLMNQIVSLTHGKPF
ncbi:MAG: NAD(P)/FAD-dependent oxidoreductase [Bacteroidetes bacterium]|nr:NAD(P)/FAD-dependent oxidoreductase [Bacteroidota bacterium]